MICKRCKQDYKEYIGETSKIYHYQLSNGLNNGSKQYYLCGTCNDEFIAWTVAKAEPKGFTIGWEAVGQDLANHIVNSLGLNSPPTTDPQKNHIVSHTVLTSIPVKYEANCRCGWYCRSSAKSLVYRWANEHIVKSEAAELAPSP